MLLALQAIKNKKYGTKTFQQKKNTQRNHDFVVCLKFDTQQNYDSIECLEN